MIEPGAGAVRSVTSEGEIYYIFIYSNPRLKLNVSFHYKCGLQTVIEAVSVTLTNRNHTYFSYHFIFITDISKRCQHL